MRDITVIKKGSKSDTRRSVSETAGLAVDTTKDSDIGGTPAPVQTGNGEGRMTKETAVQTAEKARKSGDK